MASAYNKLLQMLDVKTKAHEEAEADARMEEWRQKRQIRSQTKQQTTIPAIDTMDAESNVNTSGDDKNDEKASNAYDSAPGPLLSQLGRKNTKKRKHTQQQRRQVALQGEAPLASEDDEDDEVYGGNDEEKHAENLHMSKRQQPLLTDRYAAHDARLLDEHEVNRMHERPVCALHRDSFNAVCALTGSYGSSAEWAHCPSPLKQASDEHHRNAGTGTDSASEKSEESILSEQLEHNAPLIEPASFRKRMQFETDAAHEPALRYQMRAVLGTYKDVLFDCRDGGFVDQEAPREDHVLDAYLMHVLSHILRSRRAQKHQEQNMQRTQGFTRPRVLLLLPMRNIAFKVVERMLKLLGGEASIKVDGLTRFRSEFAGDNDDHEWQERMRRKPFDHRDMFSGNTDDHFRLGISIGRSAVKLFADFYAADMIIASPIALATRMHDETRADRADFLSSIEVCVLDHASAVLMQNWSHVESVLQSLNCTPSKQHGTDFTRVKSRFLDGYAHLFRQTVLLSDFSFAELNAAFSRYCNNFEGALITRRSFSAGEAAIAHVRSGAMHQFERFDVSSPADAPDERFEYFKKHIWPRVCGKKSGVLLLCSSYLEFCRLRAFLREHTSLWCANSEYANGSDVARARSYFADGRYALMLYSERAHYFRRHRINGIQTLVFYSLPEHANFYSELASLVRDTLQQHEKATDLSVSASIFAIFNRLDALKLERIVGSKRTKRMLSPRTAGIFLLSNAPTSL